MIRMFVGMLVNHPVMVITATLILFLAAALIAEHFETWGTNGRK